MKAKCKYLFGSHPLFLAILPVIFFLHGLTYNYTPDLTTTAIEQAAIHIAAGIVLGLIFYPVFRDYKKATLFSFLLLTFYFFFGNLLNLTITVFGKGSLPTRYAFFLPFSLLVLIFALVTIRKTKKTFTTAFLYLNLLMFILLGVELFAYIPLPKGANQYNPGALPAKLVRCDTCNKPDVYVIIADEYAGKEQLEDVFGFDNSGFENELRKRDFHIIEDPRSNYNQTIFTIASLLSMDYVRLTHREKMNQRDIQLSRSIIDNNATGVFFTEAGYTLHNYSAFNVQGQERVIYHYFFPPKKELLTFQTFFPRFSRDVGHHFPKLFRKASKTQLQYFNNNNTILDSLLRSTAASGKGGPKFVYTHFSMPHFPYFYDSAGLPNKNAELAHADFSQTKKEYTGYLQYTNNKLLALTDYILANSAEPPVILLLSDHGFRNSEYSFPDKYVFMNLCAVYLPGKDYTHFYPTISTVNIFRALLNAKFGQRLRPLKDSTIYVPD